jgi:hypothetical protein
MKIKILILTSACFVLVCALPRQHNKKANGFRDSLVSIPA